MSEQSQERAVTVTVTAAGIRHELQPGEVFTFGRGQGCTLCLDPADVGISRHAGSIEFGSGIWWLRNRSESRRLAIVNRLGLRSVLAPGERQPVDGHLRVVVDGSLRTHLLDLVGPAPADDGLASQTGLPTAVGQEVSITAEDRRALVALFAGYLREGDRYDPYPQSYLAAATRLGWPRTTLVKRIEYLRTRLTKAGVPNMHGPRALEYLAEHVLTAGIITKTDLRLIGG